MPNQKILRRLSDGWIVVEDEDGNALKIRDPKLESKADTKADTKPSGRAKTARQKADEDLNGS